ncbi:proline-rich protein 2-like [Sapajus apella]|uniref:Proline-rich protein 2-like n=1 Tax=Sapajus apella TaxID=9515 RepID=A0A6J3HE71_SAPAP|nr:proline-rich protein 2-like [Sapajus apella]
MPTPLRVDPRSQSPGLLQPQYHYWVNAPPKNGFNGNPPRFLPAVPPPGPSPRFSPTVPPPGPSPRFRPAVPPPGSSPPFPRGSSSARPQVPPTRPLPAPTIPRGSSPFLPRGPCPAARAAARNSQRPALVRFRPSLAPPPAVRSLPYAQFAPRPGSGSCGASITPWRLNVPLCSLNLRLAVPRSHTRCPGVATDLTSPHHALHLSSSPWKMRFSWMQASYSKPPCECVGSGERETKSN